MAEIDQIRLEKIIIEGDNQVLVEEAERIGRELKNRELSTSQIRGIFGTVRRIEMDWPERVKEQEDSKLRYAYRQLALLLPRLAYQASREQKRKGGRGVAMIRDVLTPAIKLIHKDAYRFRNFVDFFEAILAYHRAEGGQQ